MAVDWAPVIATVISLCAVALTTFGSWAIARLAKKLGVEANSAAIQGFDDALAKAIHAGAVNAQDLIATLGYGHADVKNAVLAFAANYTGAKFAPALRGINLDPDDQATSRYLMAELDRIFPTAMTTVAASPVMPPTINPA